MAEQKEPAQLIRWPAVGLIFAGTCDLLFKLSILVRGEQIGETINKVVREWSEALEGLDFSSIGAPGNLFMTIVKLAIPVMVLAGGVSMLGRKFWALGLVGSILAMIPCFGTCCGLSIPFGIWALIALMKPEVKQAMS